MMCTLKIKRVKGEKKALRESEGYLEGEEKKISQAIHRMLKPLLVFCRCSALTLRSPG